MNIESMDPNLATVGMMLFLVTFYVTVTITATTKIRAIFLSYQ